MTNSKFEKVFNEQFAAGRFMKSHPKIDALSICSVMLEMYFGDQILAKGTGWFWRRNNGVAIVTAWHNLSGLNHQTRQTLSAQAGIPDRVRCRYFATQPQTLQDMEIPLYIDDDIEQPRWFVHSEFGSYLDMACILVEIQGGDVSCVNDCSIPAVNALTTGQDVFAIGFPQGIRTIGLLPVWKRGSVASHPDLPVDGLPRFYVDMAGRGGLSGAPVFRVQRGIVVDGQANNQSISLGNQTEFIGLYSGRAGDQLPPQARSAESTDLGFVWHASYVYEMLENGVLDEKPEIGKGKIETSEIWRKADTPSE